MPKELRILGLDIETERKGSNWGDFAFRNFFCADMRYDGDKRHDFTGFRPDASNIAEWVRPLYEPRIIAVGHNIQYDLSGISGELARQGHEPLPPMLVTDTLKHGPRRGSMYYGTLSYMCKQYGVKTKGSIDQYEWDRAYRGEQEYLDMVQEYNIDDVICVLELRRAMIAAGHLGPPRVWTP